MYMAISSPACPSLVSLCRNRENNGGNNTVIQEEVAMNLQITVSITADTKVTFLLNPGAEDLYPGSPRSQRTQERP